MEHPTSGDPAPVGPLQVKYLDNISDKDIPSLEIPTGVPLIYELDDNLKPIRHYYVG